VIEQNIATGMYIGLMTAIVMALSLSQAIFL